MALDFLMLDHPPGAPAVIADDGRSWTYAELRNRCDQFCDALHARDKTFGFLLSRNTPECLAAYIGSLRGGHAVCLLDSELPAELLNSLVETYSPDWIFTERDRTFEGYGIEEIAEGRLFRRIGDSNGDRLHGDLALLLPTSGSTGSPKLVRLSLENLQANAASICEYLKIDSTERPITSLPMAYSYGLSVLNSHLLSGACILMSSASFLQSAFWDFLRENDATSLAGVPYHYETMMRMRLLDRSLPTLKTVTQAGGRLAPEHIAQVSALSRKYDRRFFVMYGQTEATARISYVPPERLDDKIGSIGIAIPRGQLSCDPDSGELLYAGPNVMLGYAESRPDLAKGDEMVGHLRTGDLARVDEEGYYYIVGRLKRFLKIFGKRFSLDEIEQLLRRHCEAPLACFGSDDRLRIAIEGPFDEQNAQDVIEGTLKLHRSAYRIVQIPVLPRLPNGKLNYQALSQGDQS